MRLAGLDLRNLTRGPWPGVLAVSAAGWAALAALECSSLGAAICSATPVILRLWSPQRLAEQSLLWSLMVLAMAPPLLAPAIHRLWTVSLARRRPRAVAAFAIGYALIWITAGLVLYPAALTLALVLKPLGVFGVVVAVLPALIWQASPAKQTCLNRCHYQPCLAPFGLAADCDALRYGLVSGLWCLGACWVLMLTPLVIGAAHLALMAVAALALLAERGRRSRPAVWRLPGGGLLRRWRRNDG